MAVVLLITLKDNSIIELPIFGKSVIGRSSSCDLSLVDDRMSGKHGFFELNSKGELFYTDLGSTNGSYLNNSAVHQKTKFKINEVLKIGNTTITIDIKRLNAQEKLSVGIGIKSKDMTFVASASETPKSEEDAPDKNKKKMTVILNKDLKAKAPKEVWLGGNQKDIIEQEKSSGNTRLLKLDQSKILKKK